MSPAIRARLGLPADGTRDLSFADLESWVVWQFPLVHKGWLCGAAHPPVRAFGWFPVLIHPERQRVRVHPVELFPTPEEAANWLVHR